ncbi:uncharacterized protein PV09_08400 [Verruconis gallopava]|uniref:CCHC-type domain-containing protein n=1 Tax=Verruconis gallopava TaxID=253628 RepID=A0A0D2A0C1_9PEZI|nr:uncharacterized protein PV09_08400 [Verruconis gallopava]KIW00053.1 hypothetical protein PV09_08400 [Verruconis gallopava]
MRAQTTRDHYTSHPYAAPKELRTKEVFCGTCESSFPKSRWVEHKHSEEHKNAKLCLDIKATQGKVRASNNLTNDSINPWLGGSSKTAILSLTKIYDKFDNSWGKPAVLFVNTGLDWTQHGGLTLNANKGYGFTNQARPSGKKRRSDICFKCGNPGHFAIVCNEKNLICFFCKNPGHMRRDCPIWWEKLRDTGYYPRYGQLSCHNYYGQHFGTNIADASVMNNHGPTGCPNTKHQGGMQHYNGTSFGHVSNAYPAIPYLHEVRCLKCNERGHEHGSCPLETSDNVEVDEQKISGVDTNVSSNFPPFKSRWDVTPEQMAAEREWLRKASHVLEP